MIKLFIFDLDGVLCISREWHYESLNSALNEIDAKYVISKEEHLARFDGLPTSKKLDMLSKERGLPRECHSRVWELKQKYTLDIIRRDVVTDIQKCKMMQKLKTDGYKIAVASNSIRETVKLILLRMGVMEFVDYFYSNEDARSKPNSDMYLKAMLDSKVNPKETVVIEDSNIGREAALNSGAHLLAVRDPSEVTYDNIKGYVEGLYSHRKPKWQGKNMNVVIPMSGYGSRFSKAGYTFPKPLIAMNKFGGKPMIQTVIENLNIDAKYTYIVQKQHYEKYSLQYLLNLITPNCNIVQVDSVTQGAACSVLLAREYINTNESLLIANSDQFVEWDANQFMYSMQADSIDGGMATFTSTHPKWSFAKTDERGFVTEVAEKRPISDIATVGIYYWSRGADFVSCAEEMIDKMITVNGEFYVAPTYNIGIKRNMKFKTYPIKTMWSLGTPEDLQYFNENYHEAL